MLLAEEQLNEIESMASLFFSPEDIAINIETDMEEFCDAIISKSGEAFTAYRKGQLTSEIELRTAVKQAALNGSSPSQALLISYFKNSQV